MPADYLAATENQIGLIELLAPVIAVHTFRSYLVGKKLLLFTDSSCAEGCLVRGNSSKEDLCSLVSVFWNEVADLSVDTYIDRVPTDGNPADDGSRGMAEQHALAFNWELVRAELPKFVASVLK